MRVLMAVQGTGSSVALLYNSEPAPAEAMLSHAWAGGIMEVYRMFTRAVFLNELELETRVFYCGFSLYQPQVMLACLHACMLACLRACVLACLHAHLHPVCRMDIPMASPLTNSLLKIRSLRSST